MRSLTPEQTQAERQRMWVELGELFAKWRAEGIDGATIAGRMIGISLVTAEHIGISYEDCIELVKHHYGMTEAQRPTVKA